MDVFETIQSFFEEITAIIQMFFDFILGLFKFGGDDGETTTAPTEE